MNLVINEQLMNDTKDANLCIFIANLAMWLKTNSSKLHKPLEERNFYEGRYWSYNSIQGFVKYFGFWSTQNIKTIIKKGIDQGLIVTSTFNKKKFDNTLWYSLTDKGLQYYPFLLDTTLNTLVSSNKRLVSSNNAIPENNTSLSSNINITTNSESNDSPASAKKTNKKNPVALMWEMIDVYREIFPDNPQPHRKVIATSLKKTLQILINSWRDIDPQGNSFDITAFRSYLTAVRRLAPKFSLNEYETSSGNRKKNNMEIFCKFNTVVKFLENQYS